MQNIHDVHDYDENFLNQITQEVLPIYDMWVIKPLENEQRIFLSGRSEDSQTFSDFILNHIEKDYPHPLMIVFGNAERNNKEFMLRNSRKYFKVRFDKYKGNENGQPLILSGGRDSSPMQPMGFMRNQQGVNMQGLSGMTINDLQGIIDRNVSDASRSIKAEYEEMNAKREVDSIKRIAELEMKMDMKRLEDKENALLERERRFEEKEQRLSEEMSDMEAKRAEGLGNVKDYSKAIAGGLLELGKSAFGIDDIVKKTSSDNEQKKENLIGSPSTSDIDDGEFTEVRTKREQSESFDTLLGIIENLNEEQKFQLLDVIMPGEEEETVSVEAEDTEENQNKEITQVEPINKEDNEEIQPDNNDK